MTLRRILGDASQSDILAQARIRYTQITIIFLLVGEVLGLILIQAAAGVDPVSKFIRLAMVAGFIILDIVMLYWMRQGRNANIPITVVLLKMVAASLIASSLSTYWWFMITSVFTVLTAATLAPTWLLYVVNVIVVAQAVYNVINNSYQAGIVAADASPGIILTLMLIILGVTVRYFTNTTQRAALAASKSARLLRAAAETGQDLGKMLDLKEILPRAAEFIRERFGFYHVQVFLIDDDGLNARLAASTGDVGQKLFERHHSLPVGSKSVIGTVTSTGRMVIARDTDPFYYRNELLPNTRSEAALPIFDGDKIIGALDLQSRRYDVFENEVIQALQSLANQLGTSIRNARLFESQERNARDTRRLFLESETNLREIQRLNQQLTRQGWRDFLDNRRNFSGISVDSDHISNTTEWSDALIQASETRKPVRGNQDGQPVIAVPVMLGNEVIGAIEVESSGEQTPDADIMEMVQAVAQRLAISLDKARLFEESQEATAREQRINEIVGRYQTVTNVDELLRITLEELSQTLGAKHSAIRLGAVSTASLNGNGDGHS